VTLEVSQCDLSYGATRVTKNKMICRWQSFLFSSLFSLSSHWNSCCTIHNSNLSSHFITILNLILILLIINFSFGSFCNFILFHPSTQHFKLSSLLFSNLVLILLIIIFYFGFFCEIEFLFSISSFNKKLQVVLLIFFSNLVPFLYYYFLFWVLSQKILFSSILFSIIRVVENWASLVSSIGSHVWKVNLGWYCFLLGLDFLH
jgi:hypothetical protein